MDQFAKLTPFSQLTGKISKYFGKAVEQKRVFIDIEDQSESSESTDFFSQEDSQAFEACKTHQEL